MDSADDDFGELYADVKVQASALVTGGVGFVKSFGEPERVAISDKNRGFEGTAKPESQGEMKNFGVVAKDSSPRVYACAAMNLTEPDEESEYSDSEDDLNIVLKDDDSKALLVARGSNNNNGGYAVADAVVASKPCSFQKPWTRKWCSMPNGGMVNGHVSMDASANNVWIDPSQGMPQCGYSFSHSWSRTSFDVFERKPWRNPGTEVNDFFNYGFNEQSWKDYCKPLGRAIEVGGGTLERIPSADLRGRPRDSDPDVVIEIPVTNDVEELSNKTLLDAMSPSIPSNEASRSEDLHSDNVNDLSSPDDSIKEEAFVGCQDEHTGSSSGAQSPPKENCSSWEVSPCDEEVIEEKKEDACWNSDEVDPSSEERESSLGDHIRFSPTSSHSIGRNEDSETESSKGGATDDQRDRSTPPRRTRSEEHEAISTKSGEKSGIKHSRHRRSREEPSTRHCGRADYGVHKRAKHGTVKDASRSRSPDPDLGKKVTSRHGSLYRDSSKNWQDAPLFHSNREKRHGRLYPSVDLDRDRDHRFGWRNNKESSQGRGFNHSNGYKYEARHEEYNSRSSFNLSQRNSRSSFKEKEDRYGRQNYEREYGRERSSDLAYESNKERNQYDWLGESYYQDRIPITDVDYRYQSEYSSSHGRHYSKHSHENDLHWRRDDYEYDFPRHRYEDGIHREESGIPFELAYRERHSFAEVGRREFQEYERNQEFSERHHYRSDWHRDRFVSEKDDYKYRGHDAWSSPSLSLRDSWYAKGSRGDSWRDDTRDFTTTEAYNRQLYKGAPRDGWTQDLVRNDYVSIQDRLTYEDDWVRRDRGRYELADDIRCSKVTRSEHPSYIDETLVRDIRMPTHNRMSTKQRSGYFKSHIHETDERHHGSKKLRIDGHAFIKCQDPVDLTGRKGKLSNQPKKRFSKANDADTTGEQDHQKRRKVICRNNEKGVGIRDLYDKEEGEIVEEAKNVNGVERDEERIQESLKKMEKRRERFQKTESAKLVTTLESQTEPGPKTDDTNQQRPLRKRRWCAS